MEVEEENDSHLINKEDGEKDVAIKEKKATIENLECENKDFNDSNDINDISDHSLHLKSIMRNNINFILD